MRICDNACQAEEVVQTEQDILQTLNYQLDLPTIHTYLRRYLLACRAHRPLKLLASYLAERSLQDYCMLVFLPSTIAATAVMIAHKSHHLPAWRPEGFTYTLEEEEQLQQCATALERAMSDEFSLLYKAVHRKYMSSSYGRVASVSLVF